MGGRDNIEIRKRVLYRIVVRIYHPPSTMTIDHGRYTVELVSISMDMGGEQCAGAICYLHIGGLCVVAMGQ